ncbi:MAG: hypothetical protein EXX96DRAFT_505382 [Benjaminiella poitrasii]|nr:MAG: hypothetical protein EXX96DRAFT_505382 [Benjaminiella poitrasii]
MSIKKKNLPSWLLLSFVLAKHLHDNGIHKLFLTATERKYFEDSLSSYAVWIAFINKKKEEETSLEINTAAFRVRSMLYEQLIPHLFPSHNMCCKLIDLDSLIAQARQLTLPPVSDVDKEWQMYLESHVKVKKEIASPSLSHDNTINENENTVNGKKNESNQHEQQQLNNSTTKLDETNIITDDIPLRDIFHTLELDRDAMIEQRKLEEFEAQEELNEAEEAKENATAKSLSMFNADGNFNLKYLLQGIAANRQKTSLSDRELQNLLSDFKPHRSKWANDDRVGQEELYEACEKVLTDLKNYTEHSTPFLNKVNKREAPDYFEVIKKPMDLGTVTKKMKNLVYRSKKEFSDDLYLIYENCLTYNTNAASEYRKHAIAMRRKTDRLMARVPDISIKEMKTEVEEEGDELSEDEDHGSERVSKKSAGKHIPSVERKSTPLQLDRHSRERSMTRGSSAVPTSALDGVNGSDAENGMTPEVGTPLAQYGGKTVKGQNNSSDMNENIDLEQEDKKLGAEIDADLGEFQNQVWRDKTKKTRAKLTTDVEKQYQFLFGEREALIRSGLDMERFSMIEHLHDKPESIIKLVRCEFDRFLKWTDRRPNNITLYEDFDLKSSDDETLDAFFSKRISKPQKRVDDSTRNDLFLPDYEITGGMPELEGVPEDLATIESSPSEKYSFARKSSVDLSPEALLAAQGYSNVSLDAYPELDFPDYGLNPLIDKSNHTLEQIRLMYSKCNSIRNNIPISTLASSINIDQAVSESEKTQKQVALPASSAKIPPLNLTPESGHQMSQKVLSKLLTHAGFESAKMGALNVLTDIMINYLTNIGKTMRSYWDRYSHKMEGDEMLIHSLYENGILDISEIESYVHDNVERNVHRLDDLHRKLQTSYQDLLSGSNERPAIEEDELLNDDETFITGIFGEDIGEDYFGFKDLGLDQEYNLDNLSIPSRLWFGKNKDKVPVKTVATIDPTYKYPPPPSFPPITTETQIIGLLKPYFTKRLSNPDLPLVEDEYMPNKNKNRPRYPPTNKPTVGRKKLTKESSSATGVGGEHKKHKRKRPIEEIAAERAEKAEKKRLRMEEKAQKIAEKEQKRRLREELREQEKQARIEAKEKRKLLNKKAKQQAQLAKQGSLPSTPTVSSSNIAAATNATNSPSAMEEEEDA